MFCVFFKTIINDKQEIKSKINEKYLVFVVAAHEIHLSKSIAAWIRGPNFDNFPWYFFYNMAAPLLKCFSRPWFEQESKKESFTSELNKTFQIKGFKNPISSLYNQI